MERRSLLKTLSTAAVVGAVTNLGRGRTHRRFRRPRWHGPNNGDPIFHCYNLHLNLVTPNFGIREETMFDEKTREVFPGTPEIRNGYVRWDHRPAIAPGLRLPAINLF